MVVLHVIEEGREADVSRPGVYDDPAGGEMSHARGRVGRGEHDDRRPILGARSDVRPKAVLSSARESKANCFLWPNHPAIPGASRRASSSRTYSSTIPGPPSSHLSPPAMRKSTPAAFTSTGTCPTDW